MRTLTSVLSVMSVLLLSTPGAAQDRAALSTGDAASITQATDRFAAAVRTRDPKALAAFYTEDGVLYPPGETAVKGRAAIEACLAAFPAMKDFTLRIVKVEGQGDLAYVQGTYAITVLPRGASEAVQETGYYLEIRRRQPDGRWLIAVHMLASHD